MVPANSTSETSQLVEIGGQRVFRNVPALFQARAAEFPTDVNQYVRKEGQWQGRSISQEARHVQEIAQGLLALGVEKGDRIALIADTRPEWLWIDLAILHLGAVTVGIYPTLLADDIAFQLEHAGVTLVIVENTAQLAKVAAIPAAAGNDRRVLVIDAGGTTGSVLTLEELQRQGATLEDGADRFARAWRAIEPSDLATIIYTSGTTGKPKGVMLSHGNLTYVAQAVATTLPTAPDDTSVVFLPLAHALQRVTSYGGVYVRTKGYYASSLDNLMDEIREVQPTMQVSVPRIWEKLYARLQELLAGAPRRRQLVFAWALSVGRQVASRVEASRRPSLWLRLRHRLARRLVHEPLKRRVFGQRIRFLTSGGAAIDVEILKFFQALGLPVYEGWGLTETAAPATLNLPDALRIGSVGRPLEGTEVRVAEDGELLVRGAGVFSGYFNDPDATREAFTEEGFFRTGDIGTVDEDGFVWIRDRKKDLIVLSSGKNIAPQKIENHFQTIPLVANVLVHGDKRNYLVGLLTLDLETVIPWAIDRGLLPEEARAAKDQERVPLLERLYDNSTLNAAVDRQMEIRNARLARFEQLKRWKILPEMWAPEEGSLTPTLKLKRRVVEARHRELLEELYRP